MHEIIKMLISKNRPYTRLKAIGVTIHETANSGATALNHFKYFNSQYRGASAHAFVDWNSIIQTIPWDERAWHAGRTANSKYIGIELCRPKTHDEEKFNITWQKGVWLTAYLFVNVLNIYKVTAENLISHYEVSKKWRETTHVDPIGYFKEYKRTVDDFRKEVQAVINTMVNNKIKSGKVTASVLNVRDSPSLNGKIIGKITKGVSIEIYGEKDGWYLIDDISQRWIYSKYVE